jgi:small-conductance mechanosensitive channel
VKRKIPSLCRESNHRSPSPYPSAIPLSYTGSVVIFVVVVVVIIIIIIIIINFISLAHFLLLITFSTYSCRPQWLCGLRILLYWTLRNLLEVWMYECIFLICTVLCMYRLRN